MLRPLDLDTFFLLGGGIRLRGVDGGGFDGIDRCKQCLHSLQELLDMVTETVDLGREIEGIRGERAGGGAVPQSGGELSDMPAQMDGMGSDDSTDDLFWFESIFHGSNG